MKKSSKRLSVILLTGALVYSHNFELMATKCIDYNGTGVSMVYALEGNEIVVGKGEQYTTISSAIKNAKAGDVIVVRGGTYNEQITMSKSGTANKYITIKAYPGEVPVLDGKGLDNIVDFNGQDYINFEGFKIQNITGKQWSSGVYLGGGEKYINLRNLEVTGIINPKPTSDDYGANPILLFGEKSESIANVVIENCYVHDNVTGWCEAIAVSGNCENIQVLNNRVDNNGNIGIDFCGNFGYAPSNDQPRNCVARGNVISNCNSPYATSYGLYADGAYDILFEDNIIYNSQGGIEIGAEEKTNNKVGDIIVRNNLVYGCSENGITVGGYETGLGNVDNVLISHNTVVNNNCELTLSKCSNITIENNIFKGKEIVYSEMSSSYTKNIKFNNNVYDGDGFMLANKSYSESSWKSSVDKNAVMQSVKLNSNYELQDNIVGSDGLLVGHVAKKVEEPEEPEKPVVPEEPVEPEEPEKPVVPEKPPVEEEEEKFELPKFKDGVWFFENNITKIKYLNKNSLQFYAKKAWIGAWLQDTTKLRGEITISASSISKNTEVQVHVDGKEVLVLNNKTKKSKVNIPKNAKSVDIAIVSTKKNKTIKVKGLEIKLNK